jgi:ankyrin repeat protein
MTFKTLTVEQVDEFLTQPEVIVLDHRDAASFARAHLPDAKPVGDTLLMKMRRGNKQAPVLVYCYHGNSSKDIATLLVNFGFSNVYNLEGGWQAWEMYQVSKKPQLSENLTKWLVDSGFAPDNLNSRIENGMTAIMQAAVMAETSFVQELLNAGIDLKALNDDENNALWFACFSENIEIINLLLQHGIDIDNHNVNGATCLIYAASAGKFAVVKALIEAGADIHHTTLDGYNALDSASTIEILKYLKPQYIAA